MELIKLNATTSTNAYLKDLMLSSNLKDFTVSVEVSHQLLPLLPGGVSKISESGISDPKDAAGLLQAGYDGLLIGESFMRSSRPELACQEFISEVKAGITKSST